jgi:hypothetical protein
MIYGRISAHKSQLRDDPITLPVPHLKGTCPLGCLARGQMRPDAANRLPLILGRLPVRDFAQG